MIMSAKKLIAISSSPSLAEIPGEFHEFCDIESTPALEALRGMLLVKNGFYAFEGALHVLPWGSRSGPGEIMDIRFWNQKTLWRHFYGRQIDGLLFFAEDIFGCQFALRHGKIVLFDPESGEVDHVADSMDAWASAVLADYENLTAYPLAHAWQQANGPLPTGQRLLPKIPFILGGRYEVANLAATDAVRAMQYRGEMWQQIQDLPDGAQVRLKPLPKN